MTLEAKSCAVAWALRAATAMLLVAMVAWAAW